MGDLEWVRDPSGVGSWREESGSLPAGGTTGQVLTKASNTDGDADWETVAAPSTLHEDFIGSAVANIANDGNARLGWHRLGNDDVLVDLSDATLPVVIAAGVYAVSVAAQGVGMTVDGFFQLVLELDADNVDASVETESRLATADFPSPQASAAGTYYIPEGGTIIVKAKNRDGVAARDFTITSAFIQRLS